MKIFIISAIRYSLMFTSPKLLFAKSIPCSLFAVALMAWSPLQMRADTIALSFTNPQDLLHFTVDGTAGWAFTLSSPLLVTNLGLWDAANDGLATSHVVNIWTSTGTLVAQTNIPSGAGAPLTDGFRFVSIAPVLLSAGSYTIGGFYSAFSDDFASGASTITTASEVVFNGSRAELGFVFPPQPGDDPNSYFGPNFQFTVPTPDSGSTVSLLGCALLGLTALRRKLGC
jgi:protein with PEP-CTERM/exosortase system signal